MTRKQPSQDRSRDRVEQILLAAHSLILESGSLDSLTTTAVSERSEMSVATVYRYFEDRFQIISALIGREVSALEDLTIEAIGALEIVTVESLTSSVLLARFNYFATNPLTAILWFGSRDNQMVRDQIDRHYEETIEWLSRGSFEGGLLRPNLPSWAGEAASWLADQAFETMFMKERPEAEREEIMSGYLEMLRDQLVKYTTELGETGITSEEFFEAASERAATPSSEDD